MRVVCYYLTLSGNHNVVLLVKVKDAPGVADGDSMLGKNGIYYRVWEVDFVEHFRRLITRTS